ncbi:recombinase family protein [Schleiferilactobacillus perolens]|uniref:Resolvase/invertase-type recombinase catalytic domain-containing protein n=1 Tax=Schleiferilactobacillus perolens DSM 12744 TaxID=1423792 RepID=A0A0R1MK78_9LACO|nr:recombinase family protein [Schleiferilactobacillus perolens]KRL07881.1 hypothetical protein FD09_GL002022 [Schleiferilactobacillus perolens DSM 12744]
MNQKSKTSEVSVGYMRVSTTEDRQKLGLDVQRRKLQEANVTYLFGEAMSGRKDERPEFKKAIHKAKKLASEGKSVTFVVYKLDRLARKMSTLLSTLEELQRSGVAFRSLSENIDTSTPGGVLMMQLLGMFSEFEVNTLRARTKEALYQARLEGKQLGRPAVPAKTQEAIRKLYQNHAFSVETTAKKYGVSVRTVYRLAKSSGLSRRQPNFEASNS